MSKRKTEWHRECIRCGKDYVATGKFSRVCRACDVSKVGSKRIRVEVKTKEELDNIIKCFSKDLNRNEINYNEIIKGYIEIIKKHNLKNKLKNLVLKNKKKS